MIAKRVAWRGWKITLSGCYTASIYYVLYCTGKCTRRTYNAKHRNTSCYFQFSKYVWGGAISSFRYVYVGFRAKLYSIFYINTGLNEKRNNFHPREVPEKKTGFILHKHIISRITYYKPYIFIWNIMYILFIISKTFLITPIFYIWKSTIINELIIFTMN